MTSSTNPQLDAVIDAGRARWPDVEVSDEALRGAAPQRLGDVTHPEDLFLAMACAVGAARALAEVERLEFSRLEVLIRRSGVLHADVDDVLQRLRERLFVGLNAAPARIGAYNGRGALGSWLRVCATREAVDHLRSRRKTGSSDERLLSQLVAHDPDLDRVLGQLQVRSVVAAAFKDAVAELPARLANTLRFRLLDGLTASELAELHQVHRATVDRWLLQAKDAVLDRTRQGLMDALGLDRERADSMIRQVTSRIDLSLSSVFEQD